MRKVIISCDRCGCDIGPLSSSSFTQVKMAKNITDSESIPPVMEFDLCNDCANNIYNILEGTRQNGTNIESDIETGLSGSDTDLSDATDVVVISEAPEPEQDAEPEKKSKPKQRAKIDHGKIRALKGAGWTIKKIAEEMSLPEGTIKSSLHYHKNDVFE